MNDRKRWSTWAALLAGACWTLAVNGAVPFVGLPTMGQAASMLGYAQDFANQHVFAIHATSFGYPTPTALATGLPLAVPAGWFIRVGLQSPDAYAAAVGLWLIAAYFGACRLAMGLGARAVLAALAAALWMTLPMVWVHQGYSSLGLGMALLPFYLSSAVALLEPLVSPRRMLAAALAFVAVCVVAMFMDGYTFVMFGVGGAVVFAFRFIEGPSAVRWRLTTVVAPIYVAGFAGAYALYTAYVGRSVFVPSPPDFFRGWGLDLLFLAKPEKGMLWLWDLLGWSSPRSDMVFYGDVSVWKTTFALPLVLLGLGCFLAVRLRDRRAWLFLFLACFGLYMALGPSLKVAALKPAGWTSPFMPPGAGLMPTGNAFLSEHVPGFRNMRAAYRWEALSLLGFWALVVLRATQGRPEKEGRWRIAYVLLIVASAPHLFDEWGKFHGYRRSLATIDAEVVAPMAARLPDGARIFFVPFGNDVMANYLSPRIGVTSYNVGGDKQIEIARENWPANLRKFQMNRFDASDLSAIRGALLDGDADAVVIPYFDSLWAPHEWPCGPTGLLCPDRIRAQYKGYVDALRGDDLLAVDEQPLFAIVRLKARYAGREERQRAQERVLSSVRYPIDTVKDLDAAALVMEDGWYPWEPVNRWSEGHAILKLPIPESCRSRGCEAVLDLSAFAASSERPVSLTAGTKGSEDGSGVVTMTFVDPARHPVVVPLPVGKTMVRLTIDVHGATSPSALGMSLDSRVLGVSLFDIDVRTRQGRVGNQSGGGDGEERPH